MHAWQKKGKRALLILLVLGVFLVGAMKPAPAHALSDGAVALIAATATVGYFLLLIGVTYFVFGDRGEEANAFVPGALPAPDEEQRGLRFGTDCVTATGNPVSFCW